MVDLPAPVWPTMAVVVPAGTVNDTPFNPESTGCRRSEGHVSKGWVGLAVADQSKRLCVARTCDG